MRGLYIHVPYCQVRCHYCAFYSKTRFSPQEPAVFVDTVLEELQAEAREDSRRVRFDTIYIGGGTPTLLGNQLVDLAQRISATIDTSQVKEFTIEANPESLTFELLSNLRKHTSVNRISIGSQSFNDTTLQFLNRPHSSKDAIHCMEGALRLGFSTGADIIFDIPTVPSKHTIRDIEILTDLGVHHISAYSYTPDTNFLKDKVDPDKTIFDLVAKKIVLSGYDHYEVSNFAKPGSKSMHNGIYWSMGEYIGLGPSSHSMIYNGAGERVRYKNVSNTKLYCEDYKKYRQYTHLTPQQQLMESFVFPLRTSSGVDVANVLKRQPHANKGGTIHESANHSPLLKILDGLPMELQTRVVELIQKGLLKETHQGVATTPRGLLLLDSVMEYLYY